LAQNRPRVHFLITAALSAIQASLSIRRARKLARKKAQREGMM